ncbi:hypothetical protein KI387_027670, partial [Taxus chinensis]
IDVGGYGCQTKVNDDMLISSHAKKKFIGTYSMIKISNIQFTLSSTTCILPNLSNIHFLVNAHELKSPKDLTLHPLFLV